MTLGSRVIGTFLVLAILAGLAACNSGPSTQTSENDLSDIPAKDLESYEFDSSSPLIDRVKEAPDFVLTYLEDVMEGNQIYISYTPSETEMYQIQSYLDLLPQSYMQTLQERLIGIYFLDNWIGSGAADYVFDSDDEVYSYIVVNPEIMNHDASWWLTYRETSCFLSDDYEDNGITITIDCGEEYTGLMLLLIHESSHIMDYVHHYTPYVVEGVGQSVSETDFIQDVWIDFEVPEEVTDFSLREYITFYGTNGGPLINTFEASELYNELKKTPFVSLYASLNWAEDFAEYCLWYYFTTELHQPYRIIVSRDGTVEMIYEPMESSLVRDRAGVPYL
jgi:hypothetical protein